MNYLGTGPWEKSNTTKPAPMNEEAREIIEKFSARWGEKDYRKMKPKYKRTRNERRARTAESTPSQKAFVANIRKKLHKA